MLSIASIDDDALIRDAAEEPSTAIARSDVQVACDGGQARPTVSLRAWHYELPADEPEAPQELHQL